MTTVDKKLQMYTQQMELIKRRIEVVDSIVKRKATQLHTKPVISNYVVYSCESASN